MKRREFLKGFGKGMIVLLLSGCSVEGQNGSTSKLTGIIPRILTTGGQESRTGTTFLDINFTSQEDSSIPGFSGSTWRIVNGRAQNNPALGENLLTNGDMESRGNPLPGWSPAGGAAVTHAADERTGGSGVFSANVIRGASDESLVPAGARRTVGIWYLSTAWVKNVSLTRGVNFVQYDGTTGWSAENELSALTWNKKIIAARFLGGPNAQVALMTYGSPGQEARLDDVELCAETTGSLFAVKEFLSAHGLVSARWTGSPNSSSNCPYGVMMCADYPHFRNFVLVYYDNHGKLNMDKCVDGVYTNLMSVPASYYPGKSIAIRRTPGTNKFQAWYGMPGWEAPVGSEQSIADESIIGNTYHGLFDTSPQENACSRFSYTPHPDIGSLAATDLIDDGDSVSKGNYRVLNNEWNKASSGAQSYNQSIEIREMPDPSQVSAVFHWSWPKGNGDVKTYPEIIYGHAPWLGNSTSPNLPRKISELVSINASFDTAVSTTPDAVYNTSFDMWVTHTNPPIPASRRVEVMIWVDYQHPWSAQTPNLGHVVIDGEEYLVSKSHVDWTLIVFQKSRKMPVGSVRIDHFFNWLLSAGHVSGSDYLADIEFGNEIALGTGVTNIRNYSVSVSAQG